MNEYISERLVNLTVGKVTHKRLIPESTLEAAGWPELVTEMTAEGLLLSVSKYVTVDGEHECYSLVKWPRSWWDHFKLEVGLRLTKGSVTPFGKRLDRRILDSIRWEIREHRYTYYRRVCPHLPIESWMDKSAIDRHVQFVLGETWKPGVSNTLPPSGVKG